MTRADRGRPADPSIPIGMREWVRSSLSRRLVVGVGAARIRQRWITRIAIDPAVLRVMRIAMNLLNAGRHPTIERKNFVVRWITGLLLLHVIAVVTRSDLLPPTRPKLIIHALPPPCLTGKSELNSIPHGQVCFA